MDKNIQLQSELKRRRKRRRGEQQNAIGQEQQDNSRTKIKY